MMRRSLLLSVTLVCLGTSTFSVAGPPFGGPGDLADAKAVWRALSTRHLVGPGRIMSTPYVGQPPHGKILDTLSGQLTVNGHTGPVIIKRNYRGSDATKQSVANDPEEYLASVTVMFKRERGYDPADRDWFWAKYKPDGSLHTNPKGMKLAGRVAKGAPKGCIACHRGAPGGDFVFNNDRYR